MIAAAEGAPVRTPQASTERSATPGTAAAGSGTATAALAALIVAIMGLLRGARRGAA
jgi:hypothetical protein